jgi:hypothetical protein
MKRQRSSGGEKFARGLLVLPGLRRSFRVATFRRDTPKITNPVGQRSLPSTSNLPPSTPADLETTVA